MSLQSGSTRSSSSLPAVSAARKYGRRATALTEAKQIETAWKQYYSEYERWPTTIGYTSGAVRISGDVAAILHSGDDVVGDNPKHLQFMQFKRVNADGTPVTPYARIERDDAATPDEHYYCAMFDMNYDNRIEADTTTPDADDPLTNTIQRSVIVWTVNDDVPPDDELYIIGSWK